MRQVFIRLTRLDEDAGAWHRAAGYAPAGGAGGAGPAGSERAATVELVRKLADARLVVTSSSLVNGQEEVEVAHEALIRYWPRLKGWLDADREALRLGAGVRDAAQEWQNEQRDEGLLVHRAGRLEDALELAGARRYAFNQRELDYLQACQGLRARERQAVERRRRVTLIMALAVTVVMAALAVWGGLSATDAGRQAQTAVWERGRAEQSLTQVAEKAATATVALGISEQSLVQVAAERDRAEQQAQISLARQLAIQAQNLWEISSSTDQNSNLDALRLLDPTRTRVESFPVPQLLAIKSLRRYPEAQASRLLGQMLEQRLPVSQRLHKSPEYSYPLIVPSPNWRRFVILENKQTVVLLDGELGAELMRAPFDYQSEVQWVAFSEDETQFATAHADNTVRLWDAVEGKGTCQPDPVTRRYPDDHQH